MSSFLVWAFVLCFVTCTTTGYGFEEDEKNFYFFPPTPIFGTPPVVVSPPIDATPPVVVSPPSGSGSGSGSRTPSHGTPPKPNCGPATPTGHGGGHHHRTPPSHGGGGGSGGGHRPTTPSTPTPSGGGGGYHPAPPTTPPTVISPPTTPIVVPGTPSVPGISVPSPPFVFDPNTHFTGTCNFWRTHTQVIWNLVGWWGNLGGVFGVTTLPGAAPTLTLPQALSNTRTDGYGALYREGTASLLNSMVNHRFPYTTTHVRSSFVSALTSNKAATTQANLFKMANEGRIKV